MPRAALRAPLPDLNLRVGAGARLTRVRGELRRRDLWFRIRADLFSRAERGLRQHAGDRKVSE